MRNKVIIMIMLSLMILATGHLAMAQYTPMEPIPGSGDVSNISTFPAYVQAIYKFAVWSVGIAALLMISIGGFMYFTAAGNTSKVEDAKKVISDALFGLIAVMVASMILYKINPDLVNLNLNSFNNLPGAGNNQQVAPAGNSSGGGGGGWYTGSDGLVRDADGNILQPQPIR